MPFLIADKRRNNKKRKVDGKTKKLQKNDTPKAKKRKVIDEEITSESESEVAEINVSSSEDESPDEIRKRAALKLLEQKRALLNDDKDLDEQLRDEHLDFSFSMHNSPYSCVDRHVRSYNTAQLERRGKLHRKIADTCLAPTEDDVTWCHWCKLDAVTCVAIVPDCSSVFSGSKDGTIVKWSSATGEKLHVIHGSRKKKGNQTIAHTDDVLSLAISSDGKFLVSGGKDTNVYIWSPKDMTHIQTLTGHRSSIVSLAFRVGSHELFSCSERFSSSAIVNVWNLDEMALMYNLYAIELAAIDCLSNERPVAACGQKAEIWRWKLEDQTYTIFSGRGEQRSRENKGSSAKEPLNGINMVHCAAIDSICYIDDQHALSGASDNSLAVWNLAKSRFPIATVKNAHDGGNSDQLVESWITAVAAVRYCDLVASGSHDGFLKFWKFQENIRSLDSLFSIPVGGFINGIEFSSDATFVVAGVGKQHSRGRWFPSFKSSQNSLNNGLQPVRNGVCIIRLRKKDSTS